ncbi:MAG: phosphotransferase [Patescibacteria group bacterium]
MDEIGLIKYLAENYGLSGRISLNLLQASDYNINYRVSADQQDYFLKVGKMFPLAAAQEEALISQRLANIGFPVPELIKNKEAEMISQPDFAQTLVLYRFIAGRHVVTSQDQRPSLSEAREAAKVLAQLHALTSSKNVWSRPSRNGSTEIDRALQNQDALRRLISDADVLIGELKEAQERFSASTQNFSLVHGDWRSKNLIYQAAGDKVLAVTDFEWCFYGPCLYDLGLMLVEWSCPDGQAAFDPAMLEAIIAAYSEASGHDYQLDENLKFWLYYPALCDAATYFLNLLPGSQASAPLRVLSSSHMYRKAQAVKSL